MLGLSWPTSNSSRCPPASTSGRSSEQCFLLNCSRSSRFLRGSRLLQPCPAVQSPADLDTREWQRNSQQLDAIPTLPSIQPRAFSSQEDERDWDEPAPGFNSIAEALHDLAAGKPVVVLDDEGRENEGDLIMAADKVTPEAMHFMIEHTSGYVCIAMEGSDLDRLDIPLMIPAQHNEEYMRTAFTVTVDVKHGTTTGISASERASTVRALANPHSKAEDFHKPGHMVPLRYREGGVLVRPGHTEAAVDLARLAGEPLLLSLDSP